MPETVTAQPQPGHPPPLPAPRCTNALYMDALRLVVDEPLTAEEITIRIMNAKGLEAGDARLRATIRVQAGAVLKRLHRQKIAAPSGKGVGRCGSCCRAV